MERNPFSSTHLRLRLRLWLQCVPSEVSAHLPHYAAQPDATLNIQQRVEHAITVAESRYGPRVPGYTLLPVGYHDAVPQLFYPEPKKILIRINRECEADNVKGCYQLAHEVIHVLSPVGRNDTNVLEEGLATSFAHKYIERYVDTAYENSGDGRYDDARSCVEKWTRSNPGGIKQLREQEPSLSKVKSEQLRSVYMGMSQQEAEELLKPFDKALHSKAM